jgi:hypothetical protein
MAAASVVVCEREREYLHDNNENDKWKRLFIHHVCALQGVRGLHVRRARRKINIL